MSSFQKTKEEIGNAFLGTFGCLGFIGCLLGLFILLSIPGDAKLLGAFILIPCLLIVAMCVLIYYFVKGLKKLSTTVGSATASIAKEMGASDKTANTIGSIVGGLTAAGVAGEVMGTVASINNANVNVNNANVISPTPDISGYLDANNIQNIDVSSTISTNGVNLNPNDLISDLSLSNISNFSFVDTSNIFNSTFNITSIIDFFQSPAMGNIILPDIANLGNMGTFQITDSSMMPQETIIINPDGSGIIQNSENVQIATIENDNMNNTILKDNGGNSIFIKDNTHGILFNGEGVPIGYINRNADGSSSIMPLDNIGNPILVSSNGFMKKSDGTLLGMIQKKS